MSSGRTYCVEDGTAHVWREALGDIETAVGKRARLRVGTPIWALRVVAAANQARARATNSPQMLTLDKVRELEQRHWVCDSSSARRDLQWAPQTAWAEGVTQAAEWYRKQGWL